jgi:Na+-translocating ferredoxin:NAD+ oxidoreductase RnfD subunit
MKFEHIETPLLDLFVGQVSGSLGETSAVCIIIGGLYLMIRRYMGWRIPAGYVGSVAVLGWIFHRVNPAVFPSVGFHLFSGGLMLGALYMATDPVTSPITDGGKWGYGAIIGVSTLLIRNLTGFVEGAMFAILLGNVSAPLLDEIVVRFRLRQLQREG